MFQVEDVSFSYNARREVLKGVTFSIDKGNILCLLGSNGTGKTTLIRCILGFRTPSSGHISMNGQDTARMKSTERAKLMAYVPQSSSIAFPYTAQEVVMMGRVSHLRTGSSHTTKDFEVVHDSMERLRIGHLAQRRYQELSGGEKQMVLVARALAQEAQLLIMDEPTANLDYHNQVRILAAIKHLAAKGLGILMTSHYPDHAFLACSHVALMKDGRIVSAGQPDTVVTSESLTAIYDTPVIVARSEVGNLKIKTCVPLLDEEQYREMVELVGRNIKWND